MKNISFIFILSIAATRIAAERALPFCVDSHTTRAPRAVDGHWKSTPFVPDCSDKKIRINALINGQFDRRSIESAGWRLISRIGSIVTFEGCERDIDYISTLPGIIYIKRPSFVAPLMDSARWYSGVDAVQAPVSQTGLPKALNGKNVLIGFIDFEFDTHHPAFIDSSGKTRFIALWDHTDSTGAQNNPYGYGTMKSGSALNDDPSFGLDSTICHGTLLAGIAAGGERSTPFYGVAGCALLAAVKYNSQDNQLIDGMKWIFHLADSLHIPCVINLSLGNLEGPHDGTSLIDRAIDSLSAAGRIVVGAAGNDGDRFIHLKLVLGTLPQGSWALSAPANPPQHSFSFIDAWGTTGTSFTATVSVLDTVSRTTMNIKTPLALRSTSTFYTPPDTFLFRGDTVIFQALIERSSALNGKAHLSALIATHNPALVLGIQFTGRGTIHLWNGIAYNTTRHHLAGYGFAGYLDADSAFSINEIGGTGKRTITVGAFNSKVSILDWRAQIYHQADVPSVRLRLSSFSSLGPTIDGRVKPDITAPGKLITGPLSSASRDTANLQLWPNAPGLTGRYFYSQGTSEASPIVAGIVALMLEADPTLTPEKVKTILQETATQDTFTGPIPTPNNSWGAGKVNALAALARVLNVTLSTAKQGHRVTASSPRFVVSGTRLLLKGEINSHQRIQVLDLQGKSLLSRTVIRGEQFITLPPACRGKTVQIRISDDGVNTYHQQIIIIR